MRRFARTLAIAGLLGLGIIALGVVGYGVQEPTLERRVLPDRTWLELQELTFGTEHTVARATGFQRIALSLLGTQNSLFDAHRHVTDGDNLVLWFRRRGHAPPPWTLYAVDSVDEHGCRFESRRGGKQLRYAPREYGYLEFAAFRSFPRRATSFEVQLSDRKRGAVLWQFAARRRSPGPFPTWVPDPPGTWRASGSVDAQVVEVRHRVVLGMPHTEVALRLRERGTPSTLWRPVWATMADATGNQVPLTLAGGTAGRFRGTLNSLCPHETAWKLRLGLAPSRPGSARRATLRPAERIVELLLSPAAARQPTTIFGATSRAEPAQ
jgi:hypothetical protein